MQHNKMSAKQTLAYLKQEAKDIERTKRYYTYKSEYFRLLYERYVLIEALQKALNTAK